VHIDSSAADQHLVLCPPPLPVVPQVGPDDDVEDLKDAVMEDMQDIFSSVDKTGKQVVVKIHSHQATSC